MQVTLKQLRDAGACVGGYNKLVCSLQGKEFDPDRTNYIRYAHKDPIPLEYIAESNGVVDAIWCLRAIPCCERDARLFSVWCARQVQHLMTDERSLAALDVAERYANVDATREELDAAWDAAAWAAAWYAARAAARDAACAAAWAAARDAAMDAAMDAASSAAWDAAWDAQKEMFIKMCRGEAPWQQEHGLRAMR